MKKQTKKHTHPHPQQKKHPQTPNFSRSDI